MTPADTRPASIVAFERFYTLYLISTIAMAVLGWDRQVERFLPSMRSEGAATAAAAASTLVGVIIVVLLWYFAARRGSVIARWLVLLQFLLAFGKVAWNAVQGRLALGGTGLVSLVTLVLLGIATWFLFQPDARLWSPRRQQGSAA